MIGLIGRLSAKVSDMSLALRCAWLNGTLAVVLAVCLTLVADRSQMTAVLVAFGICAASANAAMIPAILWHGTPNGVVGALGGSLLGMFPPLFAGLILQQREGALAEAGVFGWIVVFYLAALMVKTLLTAPSAAAPAKAKSATSAANSNPPTCGAGA